MTVLVTCECCGEHAETSEPSTNRCDKCRSATPVGDDEDDEWAYVRYEATNTEAVVRRTSLPEELQ